MGRAPAATLRLWNGVRMRRVEVPPEPDAAPVRVTLPAAWDDAAAVALAALAAGDAASLPHLAERWLAPLDPALAGRAQAMLLARQAAPEAAAWARPEAGARWRLNLGAFAGERAALVEAARDAVAIQTALWPGARATVVLTGLDGLLAGHGLDYASGAARELSAELLRTLRPALGGARLEAGVPDWADAVLGVEAAGIAPAFSPVRADGALSHASRARLAARASSPEAALAAYLCGEDPLPAASHAAHRAMDAALRPGLDAAPPVPAALPPATSRREPPRRRRGLAQRASVGGQRVLLVTGEYDDGAPGELSIGLPQGAPAARALAECLGQAISIGLQHGAPLDAFVDALVGTKFAPAGVVEGDPAVTRATSPLDYVARSLAAAYLPGMVLPDVDPEQDGPLPLLPLDLPHDAPRRRGLRLVK